MKIYTFYDDVADKIGTYVGVEDLDFVVLMQTFKDLHISSYISEWNFVDWLLRLGYLSRVQERDIYLTTN